MVILTSFKDFSTFYCTLSLALKLGDSLKKCAEDLYFNALKNEDEDRKNIPNYC